jgi:L-alanine-DL-glutamate epimerase-like enolase superfamily enzyme
LDAIDIAQADASRCGGISETLAAGRLAARHGKRLAPHTWSDAVAVVANAQVVAALENTITVEVDQTGNPFIEELLQTPLEIVDGQLVLSDAPGLGIELNRSTVGRYSWPAGQPLPVGAYSDMVFGEVRGRPGVSK